MSYSRYYDNDYHHHHHQHHGHHDSSPAYYAAQTTPLQANSMYAPAVQRPYYVQPAPVVSNHCEPVIEHCDDDHHCCCTIL